MLEILICLIGLFLTGNTEGKKENNRKKWDNMTTYEIDRYLIENYLWDEYGHYSRETKIQKLSERKLKI